jgi:integrase
MKGTIRKRGQTWTYQFAVLRNGRRRTVSKGGFRTKRECQDTLTEALSAYATRGYNEPSKATLTEFARNDWLPKRRSQVRPSTWESYRDSLEGRVLPHLGDVQLRDLTPKMIAELYQHLLTTPGRDEHRAKLSKRTVAYTARVLRSALADAVKQGAIPRNPAGSVAPPKPDQREMRYWTPEQARTFLESVRGDRLESVWRLLLATGLRRGEALGLKWSDIDLDVGRLSVRRTLVAIGYRVEWSTPKTKRSNRTVDLDVGTVAALRRHRAGQLEERMAWGETWQDGDLVFTREDGSPMHPQSLSAAFERAVKSSGLPMIRLHDLRHSSAVMALAAGLPTKVVSERLGHSSTAITTDTYQHVTETMQRDAADRIGEVLDGTFMR